MSAGTRKSTSTATIHPRNRIGRSLRTCCAVAALAGSAYSASASTTYVPPVVSTAPTTVYTVGSTSSNSGRVAVDRAGNVFYIVQGSSSATLMEIPATSPLVTTTTPKTLITGLGQYNADGAFVDANGNLWVSDGNGTASPASGGTDYLALVEIPALGGIPNTASIAAGGESINVVDATHCSSTTTVACTWPNYQLNTGSSSSVSINGPQVADLFVDASGNVYYVDIYDNTSGGAHNLLAKVNLFTGASNATVLASGLPHDYNCQIAADAAGNVYYLDGGTGVVSQVSGGTLTAVGNTATLGSAQIGYANGISADVNGNLYIYSSGQISEVPFEGNALNFADEFGIVGGLSSTGTAAPPVAGGGVDFNGNLVYYASQNSVYSMQYLQINGYNFGSRSVGTQVTITSTPAPAPTITLYFNAAESSVSSYFPTGSPTTNSYPALLQSFPYSGTKSFSGGASFTAGQTGTIVMDFQPVHAGLLKGSFTPRSNGVNDAIINLQGTGAGPQAFFLPGIASTLFSSAAANSTSSTQVPLKNPEGLAVDTYGDIFLADTGNGKVVADCLATSTSSVAGNGSGTANSFCGNTGYLGNVVDLGTGFTYPSAIALDGANNLYVTDSGANTVTLIQGVNLTSSTLFTSTQTVAALPLSGPKGIAVDGYTNVYIADSGNNRIVKLHQFGAPATDNSVFVASSTTFGGTKLSNPTGLALDSAGDLFIADTGNNRIVEVSSLGVASVVTVTGLSLNAPTGVAVLPSGTLVVTDTASNVSLIAPGGAGSALPIGTITPTAPQGVALDLAGNIYLADTAAGHVLELNTTSPAAAAFASTADGSTSSAAATSVYNSGNATLAMSAAPSIDSGDANFTVLNTGTCTATATVAAGASCTVLTEFTPQSTTGPLAGTVTLTDNQLAYTLVTSTSNETAAFGTSGTQQIALSGTATSAAGQAQTITFAQPTTPVTYGAAPITLTATSTSNLAVTYSVTGPATLSGSTLTFTGAGTVVVTASQIGNSSYAPATPVSRTIVVNPATQTITFTAPTTPVSYGVAPITLAATASSGLAVTFTVTSGPGTIASGTNTLTVTGAGTIVVAASQAGSANYAAATTVPQTIVVNPASQTINFIHINSPVLYGVSPITLTANSTSGLTVTFSVTSGPGTIAAGSNTLTVTGAGTIVVAATQAGNTNYAAATTVSQTIVVNPASQTITFNAIATPQVYPGASAITLTATASSGLTVAFAATGPATISGTTLTITGTGTIVVTASQAGNSSYSAATPVAQTIVVTAPPTFSMAATPTSVTVNPGSYAVASVSVTGANNFASAVTLSCTSTVNAICTFSPASVTPSGSAAASSVITIYAPGVVASNSHDRPLLPFAATAAVLCLFGFRKRRRLPTLLLLALAAVAFSFTTGCGSSSGSNSAASSSTLTITGTSGALQSTATITLNIP